MLVVAVSERRPPFRVGSPSIEAQEASVDGTGDVYATVWTGSGAFNDSASTVTGSGKSISTGTGALVDSAAHVTASAHIGDAGYLVAGNSAVVGTGTSKSTGTGALASGASTETGTGATGDDHALLVNSTQELLVNATQPLDINS